jgi:hypothetical protein
VLVGGHTRALAVDPCIGREDQVVLILDCLEVGHVWQEALWASSPLYGLEAFALTRHEGVEMGCPRPQSVFGLR